jgi:hypothetical protein
MQNSSSSSQIVLEFILYCSKIICRTPIQFKLSVEFLFSYAAKLPVHAESSSSSVNLAVDFLLS